MSRMFFLTRGVAGCGKSTFIRENNLEPYTISSDGIRLMLSSPVRDAQGNRSIDQRRMKECWELIQHLLEVRFQSGSTTILDATNLKAKDVAPLKKLAQKYRYRVYAIDFTDIPDEEIYRRNAGRDPLNRVPEHVIARMLNVARSSSLPGGVKQVTREEALELISQPYITKIDPQKRRKVNVIGDVHGCATALARLMEKIGDPKNRVCLTAPAGPPRKLEDKTIDFCLPRQDEKYIFVGDYLDRGIENAHIIEYLKVITCGGYDVSLLEGNHERWIQTWAENGTDYRFDGFLKMTRPQLEADKRLDRKQVRALCSKLGQYTFIETGGDNPVRYLITHGGISALPECFGDISTNEMIHGSGVYEDIDVVDESWEEAAQVHGVIQVHGHRSSGGMPLTVSEHAVCLEGDVEYGGQLRAISIDSETGAYEDVSVDNPVFYVLPSEVSVDDAPMSDVIAALRANSFIKEKNLANNVSSFNFSTKAFLRKVWDHQTTHARGLFIDTAEERVKARSYDKFFAIGERDETRLEFLAEHFSYPVRAYAKENGYLGICSWNEDGSLFCASKSTDQGIFAKRFKILLSKTLGKRAGEFSEFLRERDLSAVFEVIDPDYDFHIIGYERPVLVLLACISNSMKFEQVPYDELVQYAHKFGFEVKTLAAVINNSAELMDWFSEARSYNYRFGGYEGDGYGNLEVDENGNYRVEGFVLEDSDGLMVKVKGEYYTYWKFFRGVAQEIARRGRSSKVNSKAYVAGFTGTPPMDEVYAFFKETIKPSKRDEKGISPEDINIIELRRAWEAREEE